MTSACRTTEPYEISHSPAYGERSSDRIPGVSTVMKKEHRTLLAIVQLPPPVYGVSIMNEVVVKSPAVRSLFDIDVLPLRFGKSFASLGRLKLRKVILALGLVLRLWLKCAIKRPGLAYFTIAPVGGAFYRDLMFVAVLRILRIPVLFHLHGKGVKLAARFRLNRLLYQWVFNRATVIHLSPRLFPDISQFVPASRCFFLANGVRDPGETAIIARRQSTGDPVHLLFLSHMVLEKGPIVMLRALRILLERGVPCRASFAGAWHDRECARQFAMLVRRDGLAERVSYLGPKYGTEKECLLAAADVFVFPTFYASESFPQVVLEAMSFALPVVSTPEGAIPDMVEDGVTGFLVPQRDEAALADRLETLVLQPGLRTMMGQKGRERFLDRFTVGLFEKHLCSILESAFPAEPQVKGRAVRGHERAIL